jgi:hypothetical protein
VGGLADALPAVGTLVAFALVMSAVSVVVLRLRRGSRLA